MQIELQTTIENHSKFKSHNMTELEQAALKVLNEESRANGHDFGLLECVEWGGSRNQLGGIVTSLIKKGVITDIETVEVNGGQTYSQYVLDKTYQS